MRQHRSAAVALEPAAQPRAEHDRARQRDEAADRVHHRRTREIVEARAHPRQEVSGAAHRGQEAIRTPGPVADDRIDEAGDREAVEQIADETGAADHRAGSDRGAGIGEGELEEPERQERDARGFIRRRRAVQEEPVQPDEAVAMAEHERESEGVKEDAAKARVDNALHQHVDGFARAAEARLRAS